MFLSFLPKLPLGILIALRNHARSQQSADLMQCLMVEATRVHSLVELCCLWNCFLVKHPSVLHWALSYHRVLIELP
jgi:hypothetical protein